MAYFRHFFSVDPAYAGMILIRPPSPKAAWSGPRVCGDDPLVAAVLGDTPAWTPRMRG